MIDLSAVRIICISPANINILYVNASNQAILKLKLLFDHEEVPLALVEVQSSSFKSKLPRTK